MKRNLLLKSNIKFCLTVFSFYMPIFLFSQAPDIEWQNSIGGINADLLYSIAPTSDGGYILGGQSESGISGDKTEASLGYSDFWVIKLNSSGGIEWQNAIGGSAYETLYSISQTSDGGYILGGWSSSGISGDKTEANLGTNDYWAIKLNSTGGIEWQNTIGGSGIDRLYSIAQTTDGGYILGGTSDSGISGDKTEANLGIYTDYWIIKLNSAGDIMWQNTIGGNSQDELRSLSQTSDGGYILGGHSYTLVISGDKTEDNVGAGYSDYWVIKLNSTGGIEWQNTIGGDKYEFLNSIAQTNDGGYILGGQSISGITGDKTEAAIGSYDYWVIKLNSTGGIEWQNTIGGSSSESINSIAQTSDGGYILGGISTSGISGDKTEVNLGLNDYWAIKLNSTGDIEWQNTIGGSDYDVLYSIAETSDGGYILGGYTRSGISGDKTEASNGYYDIWVVKLIGVGCVPATEICNGIDDNCDGFVDEGLTPSITITEGGPTTFCSGGSVNLYATHDGASLQWQRNGVNIPGATSTTYTASGSGTKTYTCTTTSACGTSTSIGIVVTIKPNPPATITAGGATTFCAGGSVLLTANAGAGLSYQWYKGASLITGATSINYTATLAGNYKCRVTKAATGCFKNSNTIAVSVPCKENSETVVNDLFVYPNPANSLITIEWSSGIGKTIQLMDALGRNIQTINATENHISINIEHLAVGIYFIKVEGENGSTTQKFVKL